VYTYIIHAYVTLSMCSNLVQTLFNGILYLCWTTWVLDLCNVFFFWIDRYYS